MRLGNENWSMYFCTLSGSLLSQQYWYISVLESYPLYPRLHVLVVLSADGTIPVYIPDVDHSSSLTVVHYLMRRWMWPMRVYHLAPLVL